MFIQATQQHKPLKFNCDCLLIEYTENSIESQSLLQKLYFMIVCEIITMQTPAVSKLLDKKINTCLRSFWFECIIRL